MFRQLLIMRHAKSAWDTDAQSDFDRPLAERGMRDAPRMGEWLYRQKLEPDYILSSPAERAKQTVSLVCEAMNLKKKKIVWDSRIYGASTEDLLEVLADVPKKDKAKLVLMIGHNPGLEFLFHHLVGVSAGHLNDDYESSLVRTATIVQLKMPDDWSNLASGCATLVKVQNPRDLP